MHEPAVGAPAVHGHVQRVDDELGAHVLSHRPADDRAGVGVLDRGEVQPAFPGAQVGDVGEPQHIRTGGAKATLDEIVSDPDAGRDRCSPTLARHEPGDPGASHQPLDTLAPDPHPVGHAQLGVDPRRAVHPAFGLVDLLDLLEQPRVLERTIRWWPALPVMEARPVDLERTAHQRDWVVGLLRGDERKHLAYRPSVSRAKKAAAEV
jgi:hypothetical protein